MLEVLKGKLCVGGTLIVPVVEGDAQFLRSFKRLHSGMAVNLPGALPVRYVPLTNVLVGGGEREREMPTEEPG